MMTGHEELGFCANCNGRSLEGLKQGSRLKSFTRYKNIPLVAVWSICEGSKNKEAS